MGLYETMHLVQQLGHLLNLVDHGPATGGQRGKLPVQRAGILAQSQSLPGIE